MCRLSNCQMLRAPGPHVPAIAGSVRLALVGFIAIAR